MADSVIRLKEIRKVYQKQTASVAALRNVTLEVRRGEMIAIWGPSGSGKSTLLNIIGALDLPSAGEYWFDDKLVSQMNDTEISLFRALKVGFIFQSFNLLGNLRAVENVMLPARYGGLFRKQIAEKRALDLLERVGLGGRAHHLPGELSGGEEQRVAVARALMNNPEIVLADEPTGNLDSRNHDEIMDLLVNLNREGKTVLIVSHNPDVISVAGRVIHLKDGSIESESANRHAGQ